MEGAPFSSMKGIRKSFSFWIIYKRIRGRTLRWSNSVWNFTVPLLPSFCAVDVYFSLIISLMSFFFVFTILQPNKILHYQKQRASEAGETSKWYENFPPSLFTVGRESNVYVKNICLNEVQENVLTFNNVLDSVKL